MAKLHRVAVAMVFSGLLYGMACSSGDGDGGNGDGGLLPGTGGTLGGNGDAPFSPVSDGGPNMSMMDAPVFTTGCTTEAECTASGLHCDLTLKTCVQCTSNSQCAPTQRCNAGACAAATMCTNSLDCANAGAGTKVCDQGAGECVQCVRDSDCPANNDCVSRRCQPFTPCKAAAECPAGLVCNIAVGRCFECNTEMDCGANQACVANRCRFKCAGDNECTPHGQLCNVQDGSCVQCLVDSDCPTSQYCAGGQCRDDICTPGRSICENNAARTCRASGGEYDTPRTCGARQTCIVASGIASCRSWVCTPGKIECDGRAVVTCSDDGFMEVARVDCAANNQYCANGACADRVCEPNMRHCFNNGIYNCSADGLARTPLGNCAANQYCDSTGVATCRTQVCTPGGPACDGDRATTCNPEGSGYQPGGTNCAASQMVCAVGACATGATDTVAAPGMYPTSSSSLYGNKYRADANRTLVEFQLLLRFLYTGTVVLNVFEGDTETGTFTRVFEKTLTVSTTQTTAEYLSSGPINVPLRAGKFYVIGADHSTTLYHQYENAVALPVTVSFGAALGYELGTATTAYSFGSTGTGRLYTQKLITVAAQ